MNQSMRAAQDCVDNVKPRSSASVSTETITLKQVAVKLVSAALGLLAGCLIGVAIGLQSGLIIFTC